MESTSEHHRFKPTSEEPELLSNSKKIMTDGGESKDMKRISKASVFTEFDETPVVTNTKTFEELLAEKLNLDKQAVTSPMARQKLGNYKRRYL